MPPSADLIRTLSKRGQYGHARTPHNFYMQGGYSARYWSGTGQESQAEWDKASQVLARYHRYVDYCTNTLPGWHTTSLINYMDNSTEARQVCKCDLHTRTVQLTPPSGDLCF